MAGALTVSPSVTEFSVQACKKMRKDDDHPIKTITNYFSPVSKASEKVLSSPRSSNIADYFKKYSPVVEKERTPSSKSASPCQDSIQGKVSINQTPTNVRETGKLRRRAKRTSLNKRLYDIPTTNESEVGDADKAENVCGGTGFMGSDTAALLAEICSKNDELDIRSEPDLSSTTKMLSPSHTTLCSTSRKRKPEKDVKSMNRQAKEPHGGLPKDSCVLSENSLQCDNPSNNSSLQDNKGAASRDAGSTVTVSFEDFVKSQEEEATNITSDSKIVDLDCPPAEGVVEDNSAAPSNRESSLNTMTVQAQIHLTPPLQVSSPKHRTSKRIPSIFLKKGENEMDALNCGQHASEIEQAEHVFQKRKSNVVIPEEDFELAVLEVENVEPSKPKSTVSERQQFLKAFKQPQETQKGTAKKSVGKKKESDDVLTPAAANSPKVRNSESDVDTQNAAPKEESETKNKSGAHVPASKLKKKVKGKQKSDRKSESKTQITEKKNQVKESNTSVEEQCESPDVGGGLRRSSRQRKPITSPLKSPEQESSETGAPGCTSTPKVNTPCRTSDVYKAEVLTIHSDVESPIRMRFTRVSTRRSHSRSLAEDEVFTPRSKKVTGTSKTQDKAKELLEKAKAIQKNIALGETPRRRSGRHRPDKKPATEDHSVVDITGKTPPKPAKKKNLRSLNDVLGKKAKIERNRTISSGRKKSGKPSATIVVDDSSEVSENSQDNEQFKAKREFLMSGLPESLKRHISKTATFMEAYSVSSSSFQAVVHVQQKDSCRMWNLDMPSCPRLTGIGHANLDLPHVAKLTLAIGDFTFARIKPPVQLHVSLAASQPALSDVIRDCLLEEISTTNPSFPGKRFLQQFLKKQTDQLVLQAATKQGGQAQEVKSVEEVIFVEASDTSETNTRTKRKRKDSPSTNLKRRKSTENPEGDLKPEITAQGQSKGSLSRTTRKQQRESRITPSIEEKLAAEAADGIIEDMLWTEKYQPMNSNELIGNSAAVKRLHSWLKEWKIRAEKEENRSQINKVEKDKNDTFDHGDFKDTSDSEDDLSLCNTMLIYGPPGVGKTAAVYACAQELGFKVFEVNASCQRSGRQILTQLKEATQSHQVDQQGVNAHKPCFFNSYSITKSPRKFNSPKRVISSPRKPISPRGSGPRKGLAPKSLANFFKVPVKQKSENNTISQEVKTPIVVEDSKSKETKTQVSNAQRGHACEEAPRKTATSLILFEEVDVIFEDDLGFLSAVKTFMATTKRPVILTTSDPTFSLMFDGVFEEILFRTPSVVNISSFLQVLCLAENLRTDSKDFATFLAANKCDIRQSILHLQFWAKSGGGGLREKPLVTCGGNSSGGSMVHKDVPKCHFRCAENTMGLSNIVSPEEGLICFVKNKISRVEQRSHIVQLLTAFQTMKTHFIASNLEFLLPFPLHIVASTKPSVTKRSGSVTLNVAAEPAGESPVKQSAQMRRRRRLVLLNDSDLFESDSNSSDLLNLSATLPPKESEVPKPRTHVTFERRKLTDTEKRQSSLVYQCLGAVAEFADNMSYLDCFTCHATERAEFRHPHWTESRIKNGLCDALRNESTDWWSSHSSLELKANLEALSYHKCSSDVLRILELYKTSGEELSQDLTLHVPKERDGVFFGQPTAHSEVAERRLDVVKSVLSSKSFITLGNRQANVTDYLPALRGVCRFQRLKEEEKTKRRFLHYFEGIHLELPKKTLSSLAADFP